jgi:hypothetical protein
MTATYLDLGTVPAREVRIRLLALVIQLFIWMTLVS